jgi:hypothetical protein
MPPSATEAQYLSDIVKYEEPTNLYSRDDVTVISGQNLEIGAVVGRITASGKITRLAPAAGDGSQVAYGVMAAAVDASAADKRGPMIARHAICSDKGLVWPGGITAPQKATAVDQLRTAGILVRPGA